VVSEIKRWLREALSEDGIGSSSRLCLFLVVVFACGWITGLLSLVRAPLKLSEVAEFVGALTGFVSAIAAATYGVNRLTEAWSNRAATKPPE
jgi:hypothetical protein